MANLPLAILPEIPERQLDLLVEQVAAGHSATEIARRLHPHDRAARIRTRRRIETTMLADQRFRERLVDKAQLVLLKSLVPTVEAMAGRAGRGRVDAGKIILEMMGLHNQKVQHQHSGKIEISLNLPRPKFDHEVQDADVVEE